MTANVLVVDDEDSIFSALSRALRREGYSFTYAPDADTALALALTQGFQVVISDNRMPGMHGLEFLELMRARHPGVVRVLMSADADAHLVSDATKRGTVFRMLSKPWADTELRAVVRYAVQHAQELAFGASLGTAEVAQMRLKLR